MPQNDASATPPQPRQNGVQDTGQPTEDQPTTGDVSAHAGEGAPTEDKENGSSDDEGRSGGKPSGFWVKAELWLSIIASLVAIIGIPATFFQIWQADEANRRSIAQFNAEGAVYRLTLP
ncbi:hypothetical protein D2E22_0256 [Bifidobacterium castoris]|uniref:Uncharacterized protein n=2 Tax=Bifidobacterium castoris TaxID=2306972 RepID=A0A430FAE3_9BIFI|nr:hypothetical protein D2E22_0256 [Bifidobacterium castoris]